MKCSSPLLVVKDIDKSVAFYKAEKLKEFDIDCVHPVKEYPWE